MKYTLEAAIQHLSSLTLGSILISTGDPTQTPTQDPTSCSSWPTTRTLSSAPYSSCPSLVGICFELLWDMERKLRRHLLEVLETCKYSLTGKHVGEQGATFRHGFVSTPMCCPSRYSLCSLLGITSTFNAFLQPCLTTYPITLWAHSICTSSGLLFWLVCMCTTTM